ncbi:MAG: Dabb family protein [Bacteroidales bacterium]|nr:Dabb family protein [Bacteroidales bacterium]
MIKHVVAFKVNSNYKKEEKEVAIKEIVDALEKLPSKIEQIKSYEVSINVTEKSNAMDFLLISEFDNFEDLQIYQNHHEHIAVVAIIAKHKESSWFVDYFKEEFLITS